MNLFCTKVLHCGGYNGKQNDLIFTGGSGPPSINVVFFGGDVQNYASTMAQNSINKSYLKWNLERVSQHLYRRIREETCFKNPHIWTVLASRWIDETFACYDHFLPFTSSGLPSFDDACANEPMAWEQLSHLFANSTQMLNTILPESQSNMDVPLHVIGFSKGGCVVTKLFYELSRCSGYSNQHDEQMLPLSNDATRIIPKVTDLYWLDVGHSGRTHQWPTSEAFISSIHPISCPKLHVEATPYQIMNNQQPWKSQDFNAFIQLLSKYSFPFKKTIHFASNPSQNHSLETHFEILNHFTLTQF